MNNKRQKLVVRFDNRDFERSHMRQPRGRGSWAFGFGCVPDDVRDAWFTPGCTTFTQAKKLARQEAERRFGNTNSDGSRGHVTVFVLA